MSLARYALPEVREIVSKAAGMRAGDLRRTFLNNALAFANRRHGPAAVNAALVEVEKTEAMGPAQAARRPPPATPPPPPPPRTVVVVVDMGPLTKALEPLVATVKARGEQIQAIAKAAPAKPTPTLSLTEIISRANALAKSLTPDPFRGGDFNKQIEDEERAVRAPLKPVAKSAIETHIPGDFNASTLPGALRTTAPEPARRDVWGTPGADFNSLTA